MTKRREKTVGIILKPRFEGPLAEPIKINMLLVAELCCPDQGPERDDALKKAWDNITEQKINKYKLLAERYGIFWTDDVSVLALIGLKLADECVPGLRIDSFMGSPKPGRKKERDWIPLYVSVEALRANGVKSVAEACRRIQKRGEYPNDDHASLVARHGEIRRRFKKSDKNIK